MKNAILPPVKVYLTTLGCKLNESELEAWTRKFANEGYEIVSDPREADMCVLNTCTVTHVAARKSRQLARQLARANPKAQIVLTGCYTDIAPDEAKALPNVALIVPHKDKDQLVALAGKLFSDTRFQTTETGCRLPEAASGELQSAQWLDADVETQVAGGKLQTSSPVTAHASLRTRAFVKIQDGCNMSCTYCIIPLARGKEHSHPPAQVVDEIKSLVNAGYKEIILTGVQISSYGWANLRFALHDLVAAILKETNVPRLRLTSIAPWDLDESLLDLWSDSRLCRHLHLSLQSGSDTVLRRMRRPYSTERFARAVEVARKKILGVGITTDVIVGFPGESDVEFEQSLRFVQAMEFSRVHVFPYSARAGTLAATLPLQVADAVKDSRMKQMQAVADASARAFARKFVGQTLHVLWETKEETVDGGQWSGYSDNYMRVVAESNDDLHNRLTSAKINRVIDDGVLATLLEA